MSLADFLGISITDLVPGTKAIPQVHRLSNLPIKADTSLENLVPNAVLRATLRQSKVRAFRKMGIRKARGSRVSDEQILQMNVLYERGNVVRLIADQFELSPTYAYNLIVRYRFDNGLVNLTKMDRETVRNQNSGKPNKDLILRKKSLKKMRIKRDLRGNYNRREDG